jgi:hypothetical protein
LTITAVPEPSICVMTLAGLAYGSAIGRALLRTCGCSFTWRRRR